MQPGAEGGALSDLMMDSLDPLALGRRRRPSSVRLNNVIFIAESCRPATTAAGTPVSLGLPLESTRCPRRLDEAFMGEVMTPGWPRRLRGERIPSQREA